MLKKTEFCLLTDLLAAHQYTHPILLVQLNIKQTWKE